MLITTHAALQNTEWGLQAQRAGAITAFTALGVSILGFFTLHIWISAYAFALAAILSIWELPQVRS
jgi:hypothetical protein